MTSVDSQQSSDVFRLMLYHDLTMNSYAEFGVTISITLFLFSFVRFFLYRVDCHLY